MSTKCIIAINNGKSVKAIYCHWDGYPKWTGRILNENYTDTNKINRLIKLGNIDFLGKNIECNPITKVFGPDWEAHDNAKYKDAIEVLNAHKRGLGTKLDRIFQEEFGHAEKYTLAYKRDYKLKNHEYHEFKSVDELLDTADDFTFGAEFVYIFEKGKWNMYSVFENKQDTLEKVLVEESKKTK